ncbi:abscission/NoCut checkpoint regulator isoform X2 [Hydra vulgaris]|uniref:abscission/NoCut checkpoint regulator isoform X2 n=1 Tax=Hydra vulgaris TaxID=6087 RepID=UPI001F5EE32B|nr:abscission/NoCut checkpoint regulator isoform X2 [Hydra vulgaris]
MSCFACAAKFSWTKKEFDCKYCHKVFCKDCLKEVPGSQKENGCKKCLSSNLAQWKENPNTYVGPSMKQAYENLGICVGPPMKPANENDPDFLIKMRLSKLKETREPTTDFSIAEKFSSVYGRNPQSTSSKIIFPNQVKKTDNEKIKDLLQQVKDELIMEEQNPVETMDNKVQDIENRLLKLKGVDPVKTKVIESSDDEEEQVEKYIKKAIAESILDDKVNQAGFGNIIAENPIAMLEDDKDELPWCIICNKDASVRCYDCDDDLYCKKCFREGHKDFDLKYHKTSSFKENKKYHKTSSFKEN